MNRWKFSILSVSAIATVASILLYLAFLKQPDVRWGTLDHDRNAHCLTALRLATDVRTFDPVHLGYDLQRIRTWPPLHAVMIAAFSSVFGTNVKVAILPNVIVWGIGAIFAFALASRLVRPGGTVAGTIAAACYLASPSHRVFATDFMLETLGTTLTLATLYYYIRAKQSHGPRWKALAISLSLLFFAKYNYWCLVLLSLSLVEIWRQRAWLLEQVIAWKRWPIRIWLRRQLSVIANYPLWILLAILVVKIGIDRWQAFQDAGFNPSQSRHENLIHFVFLALIIRVISQWPVEGRRIWSRLPDALQVLGRWHMLPLCVWFALPKRLSYFLWYMGPNNGPNTVDQSLWDSAVFYWSHAAQSYHAMPWLATLVLVLASLTVWRFRNVSREQQVILLFVVISLILTLHHPNQKARFLHTWIPAVWVLAGIGFAVLCEQLRLFSDHRLHAATLAAVASVCLPMSLLRMDVGHSPESGHFQSASSLVVAQEYLPWLENDHQIAVLGTLPIEYYAEWTYLAKYPHRPRPFTTANMRWFNHSVAENEQRFLEWLDLNRPHEIILVDIQEGSPLGFPGYENYRQFRSMVADRDEYRLKRQSNLTSCQCSITLWERTLR